MMKQLTEKELIKILREVWNEKITQLLEDVDITLKTNVDNDKEKETVISPGLKLTHKKSGLLYTVDSISTQDVILMTPNGELFLIDIATLESEYELA